MGRCEASHCFAMLPVLIISPHSQAAARADWMPIQQKLQKILRSSGFVIPMYII